MKKFFFLAIMLLMTATAFALPRAENSDEILADMYENPSQYIRYGGASIGLTFYIDKTSIDVRKYEPPQYIIEVRKITHYNNGRGGERIESESVLRYAYDYDSRKMYTEGKDSDGNPVRKLIDPAKSKNYHDDNKVAVGEIMFYLAYGMSFYDKPATKAAEAVMEGEAAYFKGINR